MRSPRPTAASLAAAFVLSGTLVTACGNDDPAPPTAAKASPLASGATIERDPYAITCGHVRDQLEWATVTRRATVAIADREPVRGLDRLRMTQSLFYAMTEICKGQPASHEPARAAVRGVKSGRYVADLSAP
jgi:hypothetical protein